MGAAWISLDDGCIYDPVAHALIDSANYPAVIDHRYTKPEALAMATKFQTCGPCKRLHPGSILFIEEK